MKIISKNKDYYDYLVSYYGFDETRVYDRRNNPKDVPWNLPGKSTGYGVRHLLSICGKYYPIIEEKGILKFDDKDIDKKRLGGCCVHAGL